MFHESFSEVLQVARTVQKRDYCLLSLRLFLIRGHSLRRQVIIAASSRSRARCSGLWQVKPSPATASRHGRDGM
jgi:hypothetical protein